MRQARALALLVVGSLGIALTAGAGWFGGYRINLTPSHPMGLWRIVPMLRAPRSGDLIFICLPPNAEVWAARERGYLRKGLCPGGLAPLIKRIVAIEGQIIEVADTITIDGQLLPKSEVRTTDASGCPLRTYAGGVVPVGQLFLHSDYRGSYDSRYFGPVPASGLLGLAEPVLTTGS
jgi:conjugative transfer signal peptidase TraF